jgi:hypothetical protein
MIGRKFFGRLFFAGMIAAISAGGFAATTQAADAGGSCTHETPEPQTAVVGMPDYRMDADELPDPEELAAETVWKVYQLSIFDALSRSNDPRDLAMVTLTGFLDFDSGSQQVERREALRARAIRAAPDDVLVQWMASRATNGSAAAAAASKRLQHLEPENAAVWLDELRAAAQRKDSRGVDLALAKMSSASRFDLHYSELIKAIAETYLRFPATPYAMAMATTHEEPLPPEFMSFTQATSVTAAVGLPAFQDFINACRAVPGQTFTRATDCARIGRLLIAHGDTVLGKRFGYALLRVSRTFTDDDLFAARNDDWVYEKSQTLDTANLDAESVSASIAYQKDWIETGSEMEAMRRMVAHAGLALFPPNDWVDDQSPFSAERLRADEARLLKEAPAR